MELNHTFSVPVGVQEAWGAFLDVGSVAQCFPGAAVTSVDGDDFQGTCKVKLGPISMLYAGSGSFVEKDEAAHRLVLDAKGKDKRGNGTAGAKVTATFLPDGDARTRVEVATDLNITGKPAQFGRGVMQDVSDKLLQQFVTCLESRFTAPASEAPTAVADAAPAAATAGASSVLSGGPSAAPSSTPSPPPSPAAGGTDALDLGATVIPVLLRSYARQIGAVVVVLVLLRWLRRSRR